MVFPGLTMRRVDTSVELHSGETFIIGGLISSCSHAPGGKPIDSATLSQICVPCPIGMCGTVACLPSGLGLPLALGTVPTAPHDCEGDKELIMLFTATLLEPRLPAPAARGASTGDVITTDYSGSPVPHPDAELDRLFNLVRRLRGEFVVDSAEGEVLIRVPLPSGHSLDPAGPELDCKQPHPPAVQLSELAPSLQKDAGARELSELEVVGSQSGTGQWSFGPAGPSDASLMGKIVLNESARPAVSCTGEPMRTATSQGCTARCCQRLTPALRLSPVDPPASNDTGCDGLCTADGTACAEPDCLQSMIELQRQLGLLHLKATIDFALADQEANHAEQRLADRTEHMAELHQAQRALWDAERKALELQHRQALEHQRELFELRMASAKESFEYRLANLEMRRDREFAQFESGLRAARADSESLPEGDAHPERNRVRLRDQMGPPPSLTAPAVGMLEPAEFSRTPAPPSLGSAGEIAKLRREVARLRALVEDLLCVSPESPPVPKPQDSDDEAP
jgi:hypothetical protein